MRIKGSDIGCRQIDFAVTTPNFIIFYYFYNQFIYRLDRYIISITIITKYIKI